MKWIKKCVLYLRPMDRVTEIAQGIWHFIRATYLRFTLDAEKYAREVCGWPILFYLFIPKLLSRDFRHIFLKCLFRVSVLYSDVFFFFFL